MAMATAARAQSVCNDVINGVLNQHFCPAESRNHVQLFTHREKVDKSKPGVYIMCVIVCNACI